MSKYTLQFNLNETDPKLWLYVDDTLACKIGENLNKPSWQQMDMLKIGFPYNGLLNANGLEVSKVHAKRVQ